MPRLQPKWIHESQLITIHIQKHCTKPEMWVEHFFYYFIKTSIILSKKLSILRICMSFLWEMMICGDPWFVQGVVWQKALHKCGRKTILGAQRRFESSTLGGGTTKRGFWTPRGRTTGGATIDNHISHAWWPQGVGGYLFCSPVQRSSGSAEWQTGRTL